MTFLSLLPNFLPNLFHSSTMAKTTLLFIHGAWHTPQCWEKITPILSAPPHTYKCTTLALPTASSDPSKSFADDVTAAQDAIKSETSQGNDVVLVMHSYGGAVGQSAAKGFVKGQDGDVDDGRGHVVGLVMMATGFARPAKSFLDAVGGSPPPTWKLNEETGFADLVADTRELFHHDLPEEEGKIWVDRLVPHSNRAFTEGGELIYMAWMYVPVWFLMTKDDRALPLEVQKMMLQAVKGAYADVTVKEVESGHSPMLSRPEETADFIREAVEAFLGK